MKRWHLVLGAVIALAMVGTGVGLGMHTQSRRDAERRAVALRELFAREALLERCLLGAAWPARDAAPAALASRMAQNERTAQQVVVWACRRRVADVDEMSQRLGGEYATPLHDAVQRLSTAIPSQAGHGIARWRPGADALAGLHTYVARVARAQGESLPESNAPAPGASAPAHRVSYRGVGTAHVRDLLLGTLQVIVDDAPSSDVLVCQSRDNGETASCRRSTLTVPAPLRDLIMVSDWGDEPGYYARRADDDVYAVDIARRATRVGAVDPWAVLAPPGPRVFYFGSAASGAAVMASATGATTPGTEVVLPVPGASGDRQHRALVLAGGDPWAVWFEPAHAGAAGAPGATYTVRASRVAAGATPVTLGSLPASGADAGATTSGLRTCRARNGNAFVLAYSAGRATMYRLAGPATPEGADAGAPSSPSAAALAWQQVGALEPSVELRRVLALRCGATSAVAVFSAPREGSGRAEQNRALRCVADCGASRVLGDRVVPDPEVSANDQVILLVHAGDLARGEGLTGRLSGLEGDTSAPFFRIALDDDTTRGAAGGVIGAHAVVFVASGRDDAVEVYHGDEGATELTAGEIMIERPRRDQNHEEEGEGESDGHHHSHK